MVGNFGSFGQEKNLSLGNQANPCPVSINPKKNISITITNHQISNFNNKIFCLKILLTSLINRKLATHT